MSQKSAKDLLSIGSLKQLANTSPKVNLTPVFESKILSTQLSPFIYILSKAVLYYGMLNSDRDQMTLKA